MPSWRPALIMWRSWQALPLAWGVEIFDLMGCVARARVQEGQPADLQERKGWPWWKAKKWALHIAHRLFNRYGDPKLTKDEPAQQQFARHWKDHCSAKFLEAHLELLARLATVCAPA
jgi:hypothetical protein